MKRRHSFASVIGKSLLPIFLALLLPMMVSAEINGGRGIQSQAAAKENPAPVAQAHQASRFACLPEGFQLTDRLTDGDAVSLAKPSLTVEAYLVKIKARCRRGKLFDAKGKEIRLFRHSCFGNRPDNYQEIVEKEAGELARLQKRYRVLVIACDRRLH